MTEVHTQGTQGTTRRRGPAPRALTRAGAVDGAVLVLLLAAVVVGFGPVWGSTGYLLPAGGGAVVGLLIAWLGAWRRWPVLTVAAVTIVGYFVLGGALALPATTLGGAVPTLSTVRGLALGSVESWKEFVTSPPPLLSFPDLAVVPYLLMLVVAVLAGTIAWRARFAAWAMLPLVAGLVGVILLGTVDEALPLAQGLVLGAVGLLWSALRVVEGRLGTHSVTTEASTEATRRLRWYRFRTGAMVLGVAAVVAAVAAPALLPADPRTVLRDEITPPLDLHQYVTPLASFREYAKDKRETELFRVEGLPEGARVRLATLDSYDGVVFAASSDLPGSGVYTRAGAQIATAGDAARRPVTVQVLDYSGVWLPDVGAVTGITWEGDRADEHAAGTYYNATTGTLLATEGVGAGDSYEVQAQVAPAPSEEDLRAGAIDTDVELPPLPKDDVPASTSDKAGQFMGDATDPVERLFALRDGLVASGIFSSGLEGQSFSRPGHFAARIDALLADEEMVGDDEQFAVALALMAREAGIPARVTMGFYPEKGTLEPGDPYVATGQDVHAWVEVPFEGYGWAPIDAVPDEDSKVQPQPRSKQVPKPPVLDEPEPPEEPADDIPGETEDTDDDDQDGAGFDWGLAALVVAAVVVPLALLASPFLVILALKARRRTRRRTTGRPSDRMSGGWREVVDTATDLGTGVPPGATRREGAQALGERFGDTGHVALAHRADASVFGGAEPSPQEAEAYWADVATVVGGLRSGVRRRDRWRAAVSLRSLRGGDGSRGPARWLAWWPAVRARLPWGRPSAAARPDSEQQHRNEHGNENGESR
ncbi:transglutaminase-like domain-containing protein [Isoptericola sp. F-RaC21]|uniref:transglutaminase-like domain-containing protein n=1 Tax=Isoptericola sp. F-RaC21 TaxID=3141452 RepID=UPI00315BE4D6